MFKILFKPSRVRIFVLLALFSLLVFLYIAGKSLQLSSGITHNEKVASLKSLGAISEKKSRQSLIEYAKESILHKLGQGDNEGDFKPALKRPLSYKPDGLGEFGVKVVLNNLTKEEKKEESKLRAEYGINQYLSQKISLHRTLKDPRPPQLVLQFMEGLNTLCFLTHIFIF